MWIKIIAPVTAITAVIFLQACGRQMAPESPCDFVQNSSLQRVSWKDNIPVKLYLHESIPGSQYVQAIEKAANRWNTLLGYRALEIAATNVSGPNSPSRDGYSMIYWQSTWDPAQPSEQARTTIHWAGDRIYEGDIRVNALNFKYFTTDSVQAGAVDLESLLVHELGHVLGLAHSSKPSTVMAKTLSSGTLRRNISAADKQNMSCEYQVSGS